MSVDPSNPGAGDPGGILLAASKRQAHVEKLNAVAKVLRKTVSELDAASWTGSSQTAFVSAIDALVARLDELAGRVGAECRALIAYAGALDDIKVQQARIQSKLDDAKDDLRALERPDSTEHSTQRAQAAKSQDIDDLAAELTRLVSDREIADSVCVRALAASRSSGASTKPMTGSSGADFWSSAGAGMLLTLLKGADASELAKLLKANPLLVRDFWNNPPDSKAVAAWWKSLSKEQQHALETSVPGIIGNLGGVPYAARDTANRIQLNADSKNPNLTDAQRKAIAQLKRALKVGKERKIPTQIVDYNLLGDDDGKNPLLAVSYGDLDTADNSTWMVPGMLSNADSALGDWGRAAANLYVKQEALDPANAHADVAWIGYNTPGIVGVTSGVDASQGARRLAAELDADHDTRVGDGSPTSVNVVAHSYGTTTAADALTETAHKVASFTMVASAGLDPLKVTDLARLHVATTHVPGQEGRTPAIYTTGASADHLAPFGADVSGRAEPNPGVAAPGAPVIFGAQSFSSDGDVAKGLLPVEGHNPLGSDGAWWEKVTTAAPPPGHGYFDPGTQSLRNIAATSTGRDAFVDGGLTKTADSWGLSADWEF